MKISGWQAKLERPAAIAAYERRGRETIKEEIAIKPGNSSPPLAHIVIAITVFSFSFDPGLPGGGCFSVTRRLRSRF